MLLFAFVFGGAIDVPGGGSYKEFLMGGIFAQTIVFGCFGVAMALAYDRTNGAIDRFHSLPIPRVDVPRRPLASRASIRSLLPIVLHDGHRARRSAGASTRRRSTSLAGYGLMFVFSFAVIWIGVLLAQPRRDARGACRASRSS